MENDFYRNIIHNSPAGFAHHQIILDETGKPCDYSYVDVNPAFEKMTGLKKENLIGKTVKDAIPEIEITVLEWIRIFGEIALQGGNVSFEQYSEHLKKLYSVQAWSNEKGYFTTIFTEISEKKSWSESLMNNFPGIAYRCKYDADFTMLFLSAHVEKICGYKPDDLLHNAIVPFVQLIHTDDRNRVAEAIASGIETNQPWETEYRLLHKAGNILWVHEKGQGVYNDYGEVAYLDGYIMDITGRKQIEEENRVLADIVRTSGDFIGVADAQGKAFFVNPAGKAMVGLDEESEENRTVVEDYFFPEDIEFVKKEILPTVMKQGRWAGEFRFRHFKTGEPVFVYYDLFLTLDPSTGKAQNLSTVTRDITQRKMAEDALLKSESVTKALLDGISESAFLTGLDGTIIAANATVAERLNQKKEDMIGSNIFDAVPGEVADIRRKHFDMAVKTGKQVYFQDVRFDRIIDNRINPIIEKDGNISTVAIFGIDITERMQAEKALEESERTFRKLFEDSSDPILLLDENHVFVECNRATLELLKMSRDEFLFLKPENISPEFQPNGRKSAEAAKEMIELAYKNEQHRFDWTHVDAQGQEFIVDIMLMPIVVKGKTMLHITWRNITDRIMAVQALRESEAQYRRLTETILDVIWVLDTQTLRFLYVSPSVERLRGFTPEEIMAKPLDHALSPEHKEHIRGLIHRDANRLLSGEINSDVYFTEQLKQPCKDGSEVWTEVITHYVLNPKTKIVEVHGVTRNINERKQYEEKIQLQNQQLSELNAQKDKFFNIIAHDLKSPFNAIMGFSEILAEQIKENDYDGIDQYASIILKSSQHAIDLLMNLLDWARAQTGRIEFNPEYFELIDLADETFDHLNEAAAQKSITLLKDLPAKLPVFADKNMIATVTRNLISNAIKFTGEGGEIIISAKKNTDEIMISVKDNGIGIAAEKIEKLFRIDTNVSTPGTKNEKGTGLGLILCKEFIEKHDGKIWVESEVGRGSVFSFTIPLKSY